VATSEQGKLRCAQTVNSFDNSLSRSIWSDSNETISATVSTAT